MDRAEITILPPSEHTEEENTYPKSQPQHQNQNTIPNTTNNFINNTSERTTRTTTTHSSNLLLVQPNEIPVYIQKSTFQFDDFLFFLTAIEPARFNVPKPPSLHLSDDAWAALQLRVDHAARNILDPHRYYAASSCVAVLIVIVFYSIRPGYDRRRIHAEMGNDDYYGGRRRYLDDDELYDDYIQDDLWERNHSMDDVVVAELAYLNAALDKSLVIWRMGLTVSLVVLFGSVIFIAVLMERRNMTIDDHIRKAIEEIRPRVEDEGIAVEYRTRSSSSSHHHQSPISSVFFLGKYIRPTRVVVFRYLDVSSTPRSEGSIGGLSAEDGSGSCGGGIGGHLLAGGGRAKKTSSFFSEDYQRRYFPPRSTEDDRGAAMAFSII